MHRPMNRILLVVLLAGCQPTDDAYWQGYVEGEYVMLASPYAGQLQKLHVRRGEQAAAGKPMFALEQESERAARLEAEQRVKSAQARMENLGVPKREPEIEALRADLRQAQAARKLSESTFSRESNLLASGATSQLRYDEARTAAERDRARVAEAEAQLRQAQMPVGRDAERKAADSEVETARASLAQAAWRLEQKSVAAPVAGLVQDTYFVEGEWVPAGRPVVSLLPPGNIKVRFYVPEAVLASLSIGKAVQVSCDGCSPVNGKISYISSQAEYTPPVLYSKESRSKLVFLVEARLDGGALRPGQPVDVKPR